jgi:hypothetical protein
MWFEGSLVLGSLSQSSFTDDEADDPPFQATEPLGFPKVGDWVLDLRGGRRVAVPGFSPGAFFPSFGMSLGESKGKEQELWQCPVSVGRELGLVLTSCSEAKTSLSSELVLHQRVESRESEPLNIHPRSN